MSEKIVKDYQIISVNQLVKAVREGRSNSERFCFIIGSGASVSSGIPTGAGLEAQWMKEMEESPGLDEIGEVAKTLEEHLEYKFEEIREAWEETKKSGTPLPSDYYFDLYKLRFFPNHRNGYHYLEKIMANRNPGFGYHPLALMLTDGSGSNLVITTNFDSLIEDALFFYTDDKPLVINHELLAEYAGDPNIKRPVIAKVHRGIFFDPLNQPEETNGLKGIWRDVLASVFQSYTPIVIGYGGGDNSLMNFLEDSELKMKNGIYWCYLEKYGLPSEKIQRLIKDKNGYLVRTAGFDATMLAFGNALFPDKIGVHEAEEYLNRRTSEQIANYEKEYKRLTEQEHLNTEKNAAGPINESENEFKQEIEKIMERMATTEKERKERNRMTAWDYNREGERCYSLKQYKEAVENYTQAIQLQSNTALFYNNRGYVYGGLGEYDKAISDYNKAIELDPQDASIYANQGYLFAKLEKYDEAISDYCRAIELDPDNAVAYNNRGSIYIVLGRTDEAISDLNKAIELKAEVANPYKHLGNIYKEQGDYTRSIQCLSKAIELDLKYKEAYLLRAEVYRLLGETEKAEADEEMAKKL
jgi:tetratricopeptide (TPR) repeat protein